MLKEIVRMIGNEEPAKEEGQPPDLRPGRSAPIVLTMIVKNEAAVIEETLRRALPYVQAAVILDTGSTDETVAVARRVCGVFADLPWEVVQHEFEGYAKSRNRALGLARERVNFLRASDWRWRAVSSAYLFVLDAGETLEVDGDFDELTAEAGKVQLIHGGTRFWQFRLLRADVPFEYVGELHETPTPGRPHTEQQLKNIVIHERPRRADADPLASIERYTNDAIRFEGLVAADPTDTRAQFYLAQSYRDSLQIEKAIEAYEKRATMGGYDEEVFWSLVEIGRKLDNPLGRPFAVVREALIQSYQARPSRAEPLYTLGWICRRDGRHAEAEVWQRQAMATPEPMTDQLYVEIAIYRYLAKFELSINTYWTGKYAESATLSRDLLLDGSVPKYVQDQAAENLKHAISKLPAAEVWKLMGGGDEK